LSPNPGTGAFGARLLLGAALVAGTVLGGASTAFASPGPGTPGDNGTIKVHNPGTPDEDNRNEPKVCDFEITADHFDGLQEVSWQITPKSNKSGWSEDPALEGTLTLDDEGAGTTEVLDLPDGHYKVYWTFEGQNSEDAKHKVFKVRCEDPEDPKPTVPEETPGEEPTTPPGEEENPGGSPDPTDPAGPVDPEEPTVPEETDGATEPTPGPDAPEADDGKAPADEEAAPSLPVTGAALTALVAAGAVAVAGGGAAVYFTRKRKGADAQE
jgi:LPXTG-motif cell wall-anchored protein